MFFFDSQRNTSSRVSPCSLLLREDLPVQAESSGSRPQSGLAGGQKEEERGDWSADGMFQLLFYVSVLQFLILKSVIGGSYLFRLGELTTARN